VQYNTFQKQKKRRKTAKVYNY